MNKILKILLIILIIWGLYYDIVLVFSFDKKYPEEAEITALVKIISMKTEKTNSNAYTVQIIQSNISKTEKTKIIVYTSKTCELEYGDIVKISGDFSKGAKRRNYKGFSYRNYLRQSQIYGTVYVKNPEIVGHRAGFLEKIYKLKTKLYKILDNLYKDENENAFLKGILLGDSSNLDEDIKENFQNSSMSHVLAISGMHVSYVILGAQYILDKFINSRKLKNYIIIGILTFFAIITGGSPSVLRACMMSAMLLISQNFYRKNSFYLTLLFTFLAIIFINPYNIFVVGMWLSYGGTLGIVLFHKFFSRFIECKFDIKSKFAKSFLSIFLTSFAAQILIFPIMIYSFNTISFTFFISNLLIYFLIGPILCLGYLSFIFGFLVIFQQFLIMIIFKIAEFCSILPFSKIYLATPDLWQIILYYVVISLIIYLFQVKKFQFLRFILGNGTSKFIKKSYKQIVIFSSSVILIFNFISLIPQDLKIYFVDVGQRRLCSNKNS